jgi:hypothetical protein
MDTIRDNERENADPLTDHINKVINNRSPFERGFYTVMKGEPHTLPIPFPRFFTPFALTEHGVKRPALSEEEMESGKHKDEFLLSVPSLVRLA